MVLRNGKYHKVKVRSVMKEVTEPDGSKFNRSEPVPDYEAIIESQLPPVEPALIDAVPTPDEVDAARRAVGIDPNDHPGPGKKGP